MPQQTAMEVPHPNGNAPSAGLPYGQHFFGPYLSPTLGTPTMSMPSVPVGR